MKHLLFLLACIGLATTPVSAAPATGGNSGAVFGPPSLPNGNAWRRKEALVALAREGKAMQTADGGTLTPAHQAWLQARLDAIRTGNY